MLAAGGMILLLAGIWKTKKTGRFLGIVYVLCLPVLVLAGCLSPLLVLQPTFFTISTHTLIALCGFGAWAGIMPCFLSEKFRRLTFLLAVPCILFGFTFSYTYGNALKSQKQYEEYMAYNIVHDIETLNADGEFLLSGRRIVVPLYAGRTAICRYDTGR